jgi:hypothetical protein
LRFTPIHSADEETPPHTQPRMERGGKRSETPLFGRPVVSLTNNTQASLPLRWLWLSLYLYQSGHWMAGLLLRFIFLTALRQSHRAQHYTIGIGRGWHNMILFVLSILMMGSMHARCRCLTCITIGIVWMRMIPRAQPRACPGGKRFLLGRSFQFACITWHGDSARARRNAGLRANRFGYCVPGWSPYAGAASDSFFGHAAGRMHDGVLRRMDCSSSLRQATLRSNPAGVVDQLSFLQHVLHTEHHLFLAIPTFHLHRLAARLDAATPQFAAKQVLG